MDCQTPNVRDLMLRFGAVAPPLRVQLTDAGFRLGAEPCEFWQRLADAVTLLSCHELLTDSEAKRARKRLMKRIVRHLQRPKLIGDSKRKVN